MSNYPEYDEQLKKLEKSVSDLHDAFKDLLRRFEDLEERVAPAVDAQRIRDEWHGY